MNIKNTYKNNISPEDYKALFIKLGFSKNISTDLVIIFKQDQNLGILNIAQVAAKVAQIPQQYKNDKYQIFEFFHQQSWTTIKVIKTLLDSEINNSITLAEILMTNIRATDNSIKNLLNISDNHNSLVGIKTRIKIKYFACYETPTNVFNNWLKLLKTAIVEIKKESKRFETSAILEAEADIRSVIQAKLLEIDSIKNKITQSIAKLKKLAARTDVEAAHERNQLDTLINSTLPSFIQSIESDITTEESGLNFFVATKEDLKYLESEFNKLVSHLENNISKWDTSVNDKIKDYYIKKLNFHSWDQLIKNKDQLVNDICKVLLNDNIKPVW